MNIFCITVNWVQFFDVSILIQFNCSINTETEMDSFKSLISV